MHGPHLRTSRFFQSLLLCFQGISVDCSKGIPLKWGAAQKQNLGGGFKHVLFSPVFGEGPHFD